MLWLIVKFFLISCGVALAEFFLMFMVSHLIMRQRSSIIAGIIIFIAAFIANAALLRLGLLDGMQASEALLGIIFGLMFFIAYLSLKGNAKNVPERREDDDYYWQDSVDIDD